MDGGVRWCGKMEGREERGGDQGRGEMKGRGWDFLAVQFPSPSPFPPHLTKWARSREEKALHSRILGHT